jgi:hypothetical protein
MHGVAFLNAGFTQRIEHTLPLQIAVKAQQGIIPTQLRALDRTLNLAAADFPTTV